MSSLIIFKPSNSSAFNPILQKFYETICEIIVSETVCEIFLISCQSSLLIIYCDEEFFGTLKLPKLKYIETYLLKKNPANLFEYHICTNRLEGFFFKKTFFKDLERFSRLQNHWFGPNFFPQKINFILFFKY